MSVPVQNQVERPLGNDDLTYKVTSLKYNEKFSIGEIIKIRITNITEDNKEIEGNYYLSNNSIYCELPYLCIRIVAKKVGCVAEVELECIASYVYPNQSSSNVRYVLKVEFLKNISLDRTRLLDTCSKERQIEGNMLYGKGYYAKAIKYYRNALGILGVYENCYPEKDINHYDIIFKCLNNLSACYMQLEDYKNALDILSKVKNLDENNIKMLWRTGRACLKLSQLEQAREALLKARELDPDSSVIRRDLKEACRKLADRQQQTNQQQLDQDFRLDSVASSSAVQSDGQSGMSLDETEPSSPNINVRISRSSAFSEDRDEETDHAQQVQYEAQEATLTDQSEELIVTVVQNTRDSSTSSSRNSSSQLQSEAELEGDASEVPEDVQTTPQYSAPTGDTRDTESSSNEATYEISESTQVSVVMVESNLEPAEDSQQAESQQTSDLISDAINRQITVEQNDDENAGYLIMEDEDPQAQEPTAISENEGEDSDIHVEADQREDQEKEDNSASSSASEPASKKYPDDFEEPSSTPITNTIDDSNSTTTVTKTQTTVGPSGQTTTTTTKTSTLSEADNMNSNTTSTTETVFTSVTTTSTSQGGQGTLTFGDPLAMNVDISKFGFPSDISQISQRINSAIRENEPEVDAEPQHQPTTPVKPTITPANTAATLIMDDQADDKDSDAQVDEQPDQKQESEPGSDQEIEPEEEPQIDTTQEKQQEILTSTIAQAPVLQMVEDSAKPTDLSVDFDESAQLEAPSEKGNKLDATVPTSQGDVTKIEKASTPITIKDKHIETVDAPTKGTSTSKETSGLNLPVIVIGLGALVGLGIFVAKQK